MHSKDDMEEKINDLIKKSGMEFDQEFLSLMQMHHKQAIKMSEAALKKSDNQEIKKMARSMISQQEKEIKEMEKMKKEME